MPRLLLLSSQIVLLLLSTKVSSEEVKEPSCQNMEGYNICSSKGVLRDVTQLRYENNQDRLNIHDLDLLAIQEDAFKNVSTTHLYLNQNNRISVLKRGSFRGLPNLTLLRLDFNEVQLSGHLFAELGHLEKLSLHVKSIPRDSFAGLSSLIALDLSYNDIEAIETEFFSNLNPGLMHLWLDNNKIFRVAPGSFAGLTVLNDLHLDYNQLEGLPNDASRGLNKLELLYLNDNWITSISRAILRDLVNLKRLYLNNAINALESETFQDLPQLELLRLKGNKLSHIIVGTFAGLSNLKVLNLCSNDISVADNCTFAHLINLKNLYVDRNFTGLEKVDSSNNMLKLMSRRTNSSSWTSVKSIRGDFLISTRAVQSN